MVWAIICISISSGIADYSSFLCHNKAHNGRIIINIIIIIMMIGDIHVTDSIIMIMDWRYP